MAKQPGGILVLPAPDDLVTWGLARPGDGNGRFIKHAITYDYIVLHTITYYYILLHAITYYYILLQVYPALDDLVTWGLAKPGTGNGRFIIHAITYYYKCTQAMAMVGLLNMASRQPDGCGHC